MKQINAALLHSIETDCPEAVAYEATAEEIGLDYEQLDMTLHIAGLKGFEQTIITVQQVDIWDGCTEYSAPLSDTVTLFLNIWEA